MTNLEKLCNRDLMSLRRSVIEDMNHRTGWQDRTRIDAIQAEMARRIESGRML